MIQLVFNCQLLNYPSLALLDGVAVVVVVVVALAALLGDLLVVVAFVAAGVLDGAALDLWRVSQSSGRLLTISWMLPHFDHSFSSSTTSMMRLLCFR